MCNCLETDETIRLRKQHHTAKRIYDRLVYECNFTGGESTVRRLVQDLRYKTAVYDRKGLSLPVIYTKNKCFLFITHPYTKIAEIYSDTRKTEDLLMV